MTINYMSRIKRAETRCLSFSIFRFRTKKHSCDWRCPY